jgi:pimeloyl-ACP methyl ester carboxylesterase
MLTTCEKQLLAATVKLLYFKRVTTIVLTLLCVLPIATQAQTVGSDQSFPPPIGKLVDVGGYRVHLYCTGAGSPTVVIVGATWSVGWGLVQPEVAKITRVCSYDHSGVGWSEEGPKDSCSLRVGEVHAALKNAGIKGPYVLAGHSLGGLVARLYESQFPEEVAGLVLVDHAMPFSEVLAPPVGNASTPSPPPAPRQTKTLGGLDSDPNFSRLTPRERELHNWAKSVARKRNAPQSSLEMVQQCFSEVAPKEHLHPLGYKPLVDVSTDEDRSPDYVEFQNKLLSLSQNSKEIIAAGSGHYVIIDRPDAVIDATTQVVRSVRNNSKL